MFHVPSSNQTYEDWQDNRRGEYGATELSFRTPSWHHLVEVATKRVVHGVMSSAHRFVIADLEKRERLFQMAADTGWAPCEEDVRQVTVFMRDDVAEVMHELLKLELWPDVRSLLIKHSPRLSRR